MGKRRRWFRRKGKGPAKEVSLKTRVTRTVFNVSKRCEQEKETVRPLIQSVFDTIVSEGGTECIYCNGRLKVDTVSFDHAQPLSRKGAKWTEPDGTLNLVACCKECNRNKGSLTFSEYSELTKLSSSWEPEGRDNLMRRLRIGGAFFGRYKKR